MKKRLKKWLSKITEDPYALAVDIVFFVSIVVCFIVVCIIIYKAIA